MKVDVQGLIKIALGIAVVMILFLGYKVVRQTGKTITESVNPAPEVVIGTTLEGIKEQNRVIVFSASYVSTITTTVHKYFLTAQKTFIIPGRVRYEVDYTKVDGRNVAWDPNTSELRVTLPELEISNPEFNITRITEYTGGGVLLKLTDVEKQLDQKNREHATRDMSRQARQPEMLSLAKDAARRAVEHNFSVPLHAAGIRATVLVRFPGEQFKGGNPQFMDRSRDAKQVYDDRSAGMK